MRTTICIFFVLKAWCFADEPESTALMAREYRLKPTFFTWMDSGNFSPGWDNLPNEFTVQSGTPFGPGPSAVYIPSSQTFVVYNTVGFHASINSSTAGASADRASRQTQRDYKRFAMQMPPKQNDLSLPHVLDGRSQVFSGNTVGFFSCSQS